MEKRKILVLMPFGGDDPVQKRRAILNFKRIEYLISNRCQVNLRDGSQVAYDVKVCYLVLNNIPEAALARIREADILVTMMTEINTNVAFEVGYCLGSKSAMKNLVNQAMTEDKDQERMILLADTDQGLPIYLKTHAFISWKQAEVTDCIEKIAKAQKPDLDSFMDKIPDTLRGTIDDYDNALRKDLETALRIIEVNFAPEPIEAVRIFRTIVSDTVTTYYPCSVVEVSFDAPGVFSTKTPPQVTECNEAFIRLYDYDSRNGMNKDRPLTADKLKNRIADFMNKEYWDDFMRDQCELMDKAIRMHKRAWAKVPIIINDQHSDGQFRGKAYLPCLVAQAMDEDTSGSHKMYLLIEYIELPPAVAAWLPVPKKEKTIHD